jgi:hypothetical protein
MIRAMILRIYHATEQVGKAGVGFQFRISNLFPSPECSITLQHLKVNDGMVPSNRPESLLPHPCF